MEVARIIKIPWSLSATDFFTQIAIPGNPPAADLWVDGHHYQRDPGPGLLSLDSNVLLASPRIDDFGGTRSLIVQRDLTALGNGQFGTTFIAERKDTATTILSGTAVMPATTGIITFAHGGTINTANAFPLTYFRGGPTDGDNGGARSLRTTLVGTNQIRFERFDTTEDLVIEWFIVEHPDLSVQVAEYDTTSVTQVIDLTITAVDEATTRIVGSYASDETVYADESGVEIHLLNSTTVRVKNGYTGPFGGQRDAARIYVVSDTGATEIPWQVQHIGVDDIVTDSGFIGITTVQPQFASISLTGQNMVTNSPVFQGVDRIYQRLAEIDFTDASQVMWERDGGGDICSFKWNVICYGCTPPPAGGSSYAGGIGITPEKMSIGV